MVAIIASFAYFILYIKDAFNEINYFQNILNATLLLVSVTFGLLAIIGNKKIRTFLGSLSSLTIISLITINILGSYKVINFPTLELMKNLTNTSLIEVMDWAKEKNIVMISLLYSTVHLLHMVQQPEDRVIHMRISFHKNIMLIT